jgi:hypothetical protein
MRKVKFKFEAGSRFVGVEWSRRAVRALTKGRDNERGRGAKKT